MGPFFSGTETRPSSFWYAIICPPASNTWNSESTHFGFAWEAEVCELVGAVAVDFVAEAEDDELGCSDKMHAPCT